ncbi:MAG: ABC transporter permease [Clostridia bacterium]|nr:ABC transporter permease [Clostridia bacterium]
MKLKYVHFLSKSNIKGNKNSGTITLLICLLTVAVTVISCFSATTINTMNRFKDDYRARALYSTPGYKLLTDDALRAIESLEHVEDVAEVIGLKGYDLYTITETDIDVINQKMSDCKTGIDIAGLYENEKLEVIKGERLDTAPAFSCLVPSAFYPFEDVGDFKDLNYIDGTTLIGKTIKVKAYNGKVSMSYFSLDKNGELQFFDDVLSSPEFTLKIVGTYPCDYSITGSFTSVFVSYETNLLMSEMVLEKSGVDLSDTQNPLSLWWNTPEYHEYYVIVDDYDNIPEVYDKVKNELGYDIVSTGTKEKDENVELLSIIFKFVGTFLTLSILLISVILLVQSSVTSVRERKGFIGLMKAIGYKNHQIFLSLIYEQLYMTLKAFLIGGAISTAVVLVANYFFKHGTYRQMQYIIDMKVFFVFLGVSFLIAFLVPLITQLLLLRKLVKIQPREAMTR